jgi:hypothetical protein
MFFNREIVGCEHSARSVEPACDRHALQGSSQRTRTLAL